MKKNFIGEYRFTSASKNISSCHLLVLQEYNLVVATELSINQGASITNIVVPLADQVIKQFELTVDELKWYERYSSCSYNPQQPYKENAQLVSFSFESGQLSRPTWKHMNYQELKHLKLFLFGEIGEELPQ